MAWYTWIAIALIAYIALLPIALAFMRGAAMLNKRTERHPDEHEEGLTL